MFKNRLHLFAQIRNFVGSQNEISSIVAKGRLTFAFRIISRVIFVLTLTPE
jgi:hypothetical protein